MSQFQSQGPKMPSGGGISPLNYATPPAGGINLRRIAGQQRALNLCILAEIVVVITRIAAANAGMISFVFFTAVIYLVIAITGAVFIFKLSMSLYNTGLGILLGLLTLIPLLGLIILLMVNGKATKVLQQHGIKVGLLGADPSIIQQ